MLKLALLLLCSASLLPAQSVVLNWTASTTPGVTGHNIYRGTAEGGPFTKIGTSTEDSYRDDTVAYATKYYYVVTATNAHGESGYSNEASVSTGQAPGGGEPPVEPAVTATHWQPPGGQNSAKAVSAANQEIIWSFIVDGSPVKVGHVVVWTATADTSNRESYAIYDVHGHLVASTQPGSYSVGFQTLAWTQGTVTFHPGRYFIGVTATGTVWRANYLGGLPNAICNVRVGATSGGGSLVSITPPTDSWNGSCVMPFFSLKP